VPDVKRTLNDRIVAEYRDGTLMPARAATVPAIPSAQPELNSLANSIGKIKTWIDQREGSTGSVLDKHLTLRDLMDSGSFALRLANGQTLGGGVAPVAVPTVSITSISTTTVDGGGGGSTPGYEDPRPFHATPPACTNLVARAAFRSVILTWDLEDYINHSYCEIWRATANLLGSAVLIGTSDARIFTDGAALVGGTYYYWVRAVTVLSVVGPYNAVGGTVASLLTVGNTDLGPLVVSAAKLANSNPGVFADTNFEGGATTWSPGSGTFIQRLPSNNVAVPTGCPVVYAAQFSGRDCVGYGAPVTVFPGEQYRLSIYCNRTGLGAVGAGAVAYAFDAAGTIITSMPVAQTVGTAASTWEHPEVKFTIPAGIAFLCIGPWINQAHSGPATAWFAGITLEKAIDASLVTTNMIVAGSGAIGNLAVINAMIGDLAVDNAKIANLDGTKINALTITSAQIQANAIIAGKLSANSVVSGNIAANAVTTGTLDAEAVTSAKIAAGAVTAAKISVSQLDAVSATVGLLRTATSGARLEIASSVIRVYDSSNVLRVKLGDLS
jgi:hypothetical protein